MHPLQDIQEKGDDSCIDQIGEHGTDDGRLDHIQFNTCDIHFLLSLYSFPILSNLERIGKKYTIDLT